MDKPKNLRQALESGSSLENMYFLSDVPFFNQGIDFKMYRIPVEPKPQNELYLVVVPSKYDFQKREYIDLVSTEVFRAQHLTDPVFMP